MDQRTRELFDAMKRVLNGRTLPGGQDPKAFDVNGRIDLRALLDALQDELNRTY